MMQKIRPLDKPGDENLPRAAWTVFSVSTASFRWAGRKAATHSCRRRQVPGLIRSCWLVRQGTPEKSGFGREGKFRRMEKGCIFLRWAYRMARMKRIAVYAGSFDPLTNGHLWMIRQGARMFDELIVAMGDNPDKRYTFSHEERMDMLRVALSDMPDVRIAEFHNRFLVDFANEHGATFMLRGIRSTQDYEYERVMRHINADMAPKVCTVFLMPPRDTAELSSSMVKGLIGPEGWESQVSRYVPHNVFAMLKEKYREVFPRS